MKSEEGFLHLNTPPAQPWRGGLAAGAALAHTAAPRSLRLLLGGCTPHSHGTKPRLDRSASMQVHYGRLGSGVQGC